MENPLIMFMNRLEVGKFQLKFSGVLGTFFPGKPSRKQICLKFSGRKIFAILRVKVTPVHL